MTTACRCSNFGAVGHGCASSVSAQGARLVASGTTNPDTLVLAGSGMPATVACVYLQGDMLFDGVFGDAVRCAGGQLIRLRTKANTGVASRFPDATHTVNVSTRGQVVPGSKVLRYDRTYHRDAAAVFRPPETFNATNGLRVTA